jgi:dienelactone hydrolase
VRIPASDGLQIAGTFTPGAGPAPQPAVLLLHMIYGKRGQWKSLVPLLNQAGLATLAIDLRGHGETGGSADWTLASDDALQAYRFLTARPDVDAGRVGLLGASLGANLALVEAAELPDKPCLALLSPGLDYYKVRTQDAMQAIGLHPVFIAASRQDSYAAESSEKLAQMAPGSAELHLFEGDAHGADLLTSQPALPGMLVDWLQGCLQ